MQSLKITTPITRNACFFSADTAQKASEIDPREALELNFAQNFHQDDEMLMFSAGLMLLLMISAGFQVELWTPQLCRHLCSEMLVFHMVFYACDRFGFACSVFFLLILQALVIFFQIILFFV